MKGFFLYPLVIILISVLILAGCASAPAPSPTTASATSPAPAPSTSKAPATSPASTSAQVFQWRAQEPFGSGDFTTEKEFYPMFDIIEKASNGRIKIERFSADTLVPGDQMLDAVSNGTLDIGILPAIFFTGKLGHIAYVEQPMPFAAESLQETYSLFYERGLADILREVYRPQNIYYLGNLPSGGLALQTNFPVQKIDDLKGKKIRSSGALSRLVEQMGASIVTVPPPDFYMAMKLGTIDGFTYSVPELEGMGLKEVVKYVVLPYLVANVGTGFCINMNKWNALPPDLQQTVQKVFADNMISLANNYVAEQERVLKGLKDVKVVTLPDNEVQKLKGLAVNYWDELAKEGPELAKAVKIIKDYHNIK